MTDKGTMPFSSSRTDFELKRKTSFIHMAGEASSSVSRPLPHDARSNTTLLNALSSRTLSYLKRDPESLSTSILDHVEYTLARTRYDFTSDSCYRAVAYSARDRLLEIFNDTNMHFHEVDCKRGYYLSLEFLLGRLLQNTLVNMDMETNYRQALFNLGTDMEDLFEAEKDPALGNGGLGRLAACFLDSMATLGLPVWGYGLRYSYGIFEQVMVNGRQVERPDYWLGYHNPWEIVRPDVTYAVRFYGQVVDYVDEKDSGSTPGASSVGPGGGSSSAQLGFKRKRWIGGKVVAAVAYDNPVPGFDSSNCINLRLWKAEPSKEFDLQAFNEGRHTDAVNDKEWAERLTNVLYPNDSTDEGKQLRLRQQYFFVCATVQDILRRFKKRPGRKWDELPSKVVMQLNDTHPSLAIPEVMRVLIDIEGLSWDEAWGYTKSIFNYTNHTVLPEALECWSPELLGSLLPRHLEIINHINYCFLQGVADELGWNHPAVSRMSIYQEEPVKMLRMAHLCVIGTSKVNGVAALHTEIVKKNLFPDFCQWFASHGSPSKFVNVTNGVTQRRWLHVANRDLSLLISSTLGSDEWLTDLSRLEALSNQKDNPRLQQQWGEIKVKSKRALARWVKTATGVSVDEDSLFDVQVKRIHEYKRQLLNVFHVVHRYLLLKTLPKRERAKQLSRTVFIGGKAAPGYHRAKAIIKLVSNVAAVINADPETADKLKLVFLPNYCVSRAQLIVPASDISQHISTAGTEASGTSNMKFVMNGGLILGTMDGANVEIRQEIGPENMFIFGALDSEVEPIRTRARHGDYPIDPRLARVLNTIKSGLFSLNDGGAQTEFDDLIDCISNNGNGRNGDYYLVFHDFPAYIEAQRRIDDAYRDKERWTRMSIQSTALSGLFSTDRSIREYAELIWNIQPQERAAPNHSAAPELVA